MTVLLKNIMLKVYRVTYHLATWVELTLICMFHSICPATQPILPYSHLPKQNRADNETAKIKVNPTQVTR